MPPRPTGRVPIHAKGFIPPDKNRINGRPPENRDKVGGIVNKNTNNNQ